jgi:hypothetical protein
MVPNAPVCPGAFAEVHPMAAEAALEFKDTYVTKGFIILVRPSSLHSGTDRLC